MIALIGHLGNMGRRYSTILKYLEIDFKGIDVDTSFEEREDILSHANKAIICTSTRTHLELASEMQRRDITFLCEKPFAKFFPSDFEPKNGFIVNNWAYVIQPHVKDIYYNFYNTGKDGLLWDICQLITLSFKNNAKLTVQCNSPFWNVKLDGRQVAYKEIETSYFQMIKDFAEDKKENLWPIEVGLDQIRQVHIVSLDVGVAHEQSVINNSGTIKIDPATWKDFRNHSGEKYSSMGS